MVRLDTSREAFSTLTAFRVLGEMAKRKRCSAKELSEATGISMTSVYRILRFLIRERLISLYGYKPTAGRGAKPDEYFIHPKTVCAVLDVRGGSPDLFVYSIPGLEESMISPKIRSDQRETEKIALIKGACFDELFRTVPAKYIWTVSAVSDTESGPAADKADVSLYIPDELLPEVFVFSAEKLKAETEKRDAASGIKHVVGKDATNVRKEAVRRSIEKQMELNL